MANPKRKTSKAKQRRRRASWMSSGDVTVARCPQCKKLIKPHAVCQYCGFYKDKKEVTTKEEIREAKRVKENG
ncbi:MAG: 50S ribosomal protein L32 [Elusimicrobia bacterium CG_4_10_14_3_um_filter_49_12_50_7]|nr:MAG: 50S ribosomal protein L32 [Elusimicrobia bacterium CG03_land_8_20_14_0_80_50_18]PIX14813.1 MAG: 50S ribosomal protein L32 [Elusimicrobia bacterium CG_4_8_14_3_um_filter_50_9]PIY17589.1 MAG: 50S ribosomal protein L32 [Elusimicrobia bacterium CG_4_10_14_3_um_filter_49_12_50_7]